MSTKVWTLTFAMAHHESAFRMVYKTQEAATTAMGLYIAEKQGAMCPGKQLFLSDDFGRTAIVDTLHCLFCLLEPIASRTIEAPPGGGFGIDWAGGPRA